MSRHKPKPLVCPKCHSGFSKVKDCGDPTERVRKWADWSGRGLWRLRECERCGTRFTTEETVTGLYPS